TRLEIVRTVLIGALVILASLLLAMWIDLVVPIPMDGRWAFTRIGLVVAAISIASICFLKIRRCTPARVASIVDTRAKTGGEALAGWQLERRPPAKSSTLTRGFAQMASARAGGLLAKIAPESVLPLNPVRKSAWLLCGCVFVTVVLAALMPRVAWNQ